VYLPLEMHVRWKTKTLASNRQMGEPTCPHTRVKKPVTFTPVMMAVEGRKQSYAHRLGPAIRRCCLGNGLAQAAWWWEVDQRWKDLALNGLEDPELTAALLSEKALINQILEAVVPRPSKADQREYREFKKLYQMPRKVKTQLPAFAKILGVPWPCTEDDLKAVWKKLALQHHPDRGGRQEDFIRVKAAYDQACERLG
jgi:hypothetical protein